eukprot:jgi/Mesen1/7482/ME000039S06697
MGETTVSVIAGFCAGISEVLVGHPFDTIKTKIQTQAVDRVGDKVVYKGPLHCASAIIRREGLAGLYRGILSPLIQNAMGVALLFGAMDWLREHLGASIFAPHRFVLACVLIGTIESVLYCPLEHVKARLQVGTGRRGAAAARRGPIGGVGVGVGVGGGGGGGGGGKNVAELQLAGSLQVMRDILTAKGPLGLYHGWVFQWLKETGRGGSKHAHPEGLHWLHIWPAGSLAGMAYYSVGFPFDTIKTRMQTDSLTHPRYRSFIHAGLQVLHEEGSWRELYRGLSACLLRAIPGSAVQFIMFEIVASVLTAMVTFHSSVKPHMANMEHFVHLEHFV